MYECVECSEVITNPLCPGCLKEGITQWLSETEPEKLREFRKLHSGLVEVQGDIRCIVCNKKMELCTHCYSTHVRDWLKQTPSLQASIPEFTTFFNFELSLEDAAEERL